MAALELALGVLVILVPLAVLVLSFGPWLEHRTFVRLAAAEAARLVVTTNGDEGAARARIAGLASGSGIGADGVSVSFCGGDRTPLGAAPAGSCGERVPRGGTVTVEVAVAVPLVVTPYGPLAVREAAYRHTEPVDPYRSIP